MIKYLLGLGSNIEDRKNNLLQAQCLLERVFSDMKNSDIYESAAMLPDGAPEEWDVPYLNMCLVGHSELSPFVMLERIQDIENQVGAMRNTQRWSPRVLDIDILLVGDMVIQEGNLQVPHPGLAVRDFVIVPALQIWGDAFHPLEGKYLRELSGGVSTGVRIYED